MKTRLAQWVMGMTLALAVMGMQTGSLWSQTSATPGAGENPALKGTASTGTASGGDHSQQVRDALVKAYHDTQTYDAQVTFTVSQKQGRVRQEMDTRIALDRAHKALLIDRPDAQLSSDGNKLRLTVEQVPNQHLEADTPDPLDYTALEKIIPMDALLSPDVAFLLADDPWAVLTRHSVAQVTVTPADDGGQIIQLEYGGNHTWVLHTDPATGLLRQARLDITGGQGQSMSLIYDITLQGAGKPLDAKMFAFTHTASQPVATVQALLSGGQGGSGGGQDPLLNQPLPAFKLVTLDGKDFDSSREPARVVLYSFWATWCPPCREELPYLQKVGDWAARENKPVAVYLINAQETAAEVRQYLQQAKITLPTLLDGDGSVAGKMGVQTLPHLIIVADGKVVEIKDGIPGDPALLARYDQDLEKQIEELLAKPAPAPATAPATQP